MFKMLIDAEQVLSKENRSNREVKYSQTSNID